MALDSHQRETELFGRAIDLDPGEQRAFLARECAGDAALAERVLRLLIRDRETGTRLDRSPHEVLAQRPISARLPERIGPYRILGLLGQGGMGIVYRAQQESPRREVALKVIRSGTPSLELVRRFEKEAHVLSRLDHQGIARIFDAGVFEGPRGPEPFVTMELVQGEPLLAFVEHHILSRAERIELLARIGDAVAHAHEHGIVHRDLKPSNVLVKDDGQPKVLDFGVALIVHAGEEGSTRQTSPGELIGTLPYMSPEQLAGAPAQIDERSDVYALGVMAFELLTGRHPHALEGLALPAAARLVAERAAPRLGSLDRALHGDLETIVAKALANDHAQRYSSARELADDLRRYLRHEPVRAVPPSSLYYLRRFARRNPALATSLVLAALLLVAGTVVSTWQARRAEDARQRADDLRTLADEEAKRARRAAQQSALAAAQIAAEHHDFTASRRLLDSIEPAARGWVWRWLARCNDERVAHYAAGEPLLCAAFVPDSQELVIVDAAGTLARWAPGEAAPRARLKLGVRLTGPAAFDREARFVAGVHGTEPQTITLWDASDARRIAEVSTPELQSYAVAVAAGGSRVAFGGRSALEHGMFLWDTSGTAPVAIVPDARTGTVIAAAFSGDGSRLGCAYNSALDGPGWYVSIDTRSGRAAGEARQPASIDALGVALDRSGRAALALRNKRAYLLDPDPKAPAIALSGDLGAVLSVTFDAAGERVATGSDYGTVRLWDAREGHELAVLSGSNAPARQLAFSGDGSRVMALSPHEIGVWNAASEPDVLRGHGSYVYDLAFVRGGARLISLGFDGELCVWDPDSSEPLHERKLSWPITYALAAARDGALLAVGEPSGASILDGDSLRRVRSLQLGAPARDVSFSPDGERLAGVGESRLAVWDVASGERRGSWTLDSGSPYPDVTFSHDGRWLACADRTPAVLVRDPSSGAELARLLGHGGAVEALAFSPDDALLASGSTDRSVRLWDTRTWRVRAVLEGHTDRVYALAFSPDGELLASGSNDTSIRLWSVATGEELALLTGHDDYVFALAFDPDGSRLASASGDHTVRLWDTRTRAERWHAGELARARRDGVRPRMAERLAAAGDLAAALAGLDADKTLAPEERESSVQALLQLEAEPPH